MIKFSNKELGVILGYCMVVGVCKTLNEEEKAINDSIIEKIKGHLNNMTNQLKEMINK